VLSNLLSNAIKFTEKGIVELAYTIKAEDNHKVTVAFCVKDNGIGISEQQQEHIFESFTQANESITRKYGGTGLGLTICKKLVELQGGKIGLKSSEGIGSEFSVELTFDNHIYNDNALKNPALIDKTQSKDLTGLSILVAEDNTVNAMVLTRFLSIWNVKNKIAKDGLEVLDLLEKEHFDMILMDIQMPNLDGTEATQRIRESQNLAWKNLPIVAFTADASLDTHKSLLKLGFDYCITKPFNPDALFSFLQKKHAGITESKNSLIILLNQE
jgi:CheY-like chemotaxis protein